MTLTYGVVGTQIYYDDYDSLGLGTLMTLMD